MKFYIIVACVFLLANTVCTQQGEVPVLTQPNSGCSEGYVKDSKGDCQKVKVGILGLLLPKSCVNLTCPEMVFRRIKLNGQKRFTIINNL